MNTHSLSKLIVFSKFKLNIYNKIKAALSILGSEHLLQLIETKHARK